jgi:hypothetical protein
MVNFMGVITLLSVSYVMKDINKWLVSVDNL